MTPSGGVLGVFPPAAAWPLDALVSPCRHRLFLVVSSVVVAALALSPLAAQIGELHQQPADRPLVLSKPVFPTLFDVTPTRVTVTRDWQKFTLDVPRWQFLSDRTLWQQMHFEDWDRLDPAARNGGLTEMVADFGRLVTDWRQWRQMSALDWDHVPQPIRAMAFVGMIEHWLAFYQVGSTYGLEPAVIARTAKAIAMTESWFDHRALYVNRDGSRDLGLGGASDFARAAMGRLVRQGRADFTLTEEEFGNPWLATRWLAFWWQLMLDEAAGNLDLATRAYNVGIARAMRGAGRDYLAMVHDRRHRYFDGPSGSPTWSALSQYRRDRLWLPRVVVRRLLPAAAVVLPGDDRWPAAIPMVPPDE